MRIGNSKMIVPYGCIEALRTRVMWSGNIEGTGVCGKLVNRYWSLSVFVSAGSKQVTRPIVDVWEIKG